MKQLIQKILANKGYVLTKTEVDWKSDQLIYEQYYSEDSIKNRRFYNIGAGRFRHPFWTNIDKVSSHYKSRISEDNIDFDLFDKKHLPIENDSAEVFYSSHTLEHIDTPSGQFLIDEIFQKLKVGGVVRLTMPDIDLAYEAYKKNDKTFFIWLKKWSKLFPDPRLNFTVDPMECDIEQIFLSHFAHHAAAIHPDRVDDYVTSENLNKIFAENEYEDALNILISKCSIEMQLQHPGQHINWYNFDKVKAMLMQAGFKNIYRSGYLQSKYPIMRNTLFDSTTPATSLYVEAVK
jgi:predicted SAM-dependent methyltransferase